MTRRAAPEVRKPRRDPVVLALRVLVRWAAGKHWHGRPLSDATFWRPGTQPLGEGYWSARGSWWGMRSGKHRLAVRVAVLALAVGLWRWRSGTEWTLALAGGPLAGWLAWRAFARLRLWQHLREVEQPLSAALAPYLGLAPMAVEAALSIRPDYDDAGSGEHIGSLMLPDHWAATPDQRRQVEQIIDARFGVGLRWQWATTGYPMLLNFTRAPVPPALVTFAEVRELAESYPPHRVLLGRDAEGKVRDWDTSQEDPHLAVHGGSRRGKTSLLLSIAAQELRKGGGVTGVDPKRVSLAPLAGIPGARLFSDPRDVPAMWRGIAEFREMVEDRYDQLAADPTLEFRRELLIIDEVSQCAGMWAMHWRSVKQRQDPALPPVWNDVAAAVWMGAQAHAHVVVAGQRLDHAILGGMLGSFGVRMLAGYTPNDYARLVGLLPFQRSQKPRGRFLLYEGGECTWLQLVKVDNPDRDYTALRDWALAGALAHAEGRSDLAAATGTGTGDSPLAARIVVGLAAAAELLGMETEAFKKARQRRPVPGELLGPDGRSPAWRPVDLTDWRESRPSTQRAS